MSVFTNPAARSTEHAAAYVRAVLELLGEAQPLDVLARTPEALRTAVAGLSDAQLSAPEAAGKWSIRQVLRHLADTEVVYGFRMRMALAHDRPRLAGFDQDAWAERLGYANADAGAALEEFTALRRTHVALLRRASPADLARVVVHEERGDESVELMMRLYAGHDLVHLRQIARIRATHDAPHAGDGA